MSRREGGGPTADRVTRLAGGGASPYAVRLPVFEGPLDLLLHLIRINEVEITDIPVALIAEQYLEYLDLLDELHIDVAGEYLVMAATLAWIKSRMLLPSLAEEGEEEADPRAELVARLLEYQRFKEAAESLGDRRLLGRDVFAARGAEPEPVPEAEREVEVGLFELVEALRRALARAPHSGAAHEIEVETVTVHERMLAVMDALLGRDALAFDEVLVGPRGEPASLPVLVATFLAVLELTRVAALRLYQTLDERGAPSGPIRLRLADETSAGDWKARISNWM